AWTALVGLSVVACEDLGRLRWLGRIFAGNDPEHVLEACAPDDAGTPRYVELACAGSLVRWRVGAPSYRSPARGEAFVVLGFTELETKRPIRRRIAVSALSTSGIALLALLAFIVPR
ncbi:MAG: hypothetical protein ABIP39_03715, partial [Polyangiaceae bacterium]